MTLTDYLAHSGRVISRFQHVYGELQNWPRDVYRDVYGMLQYRYSQLNSNHDHETPLDVCRSLFTCDNYVGIEGVGHAL